MKYTSILWGVFILMVMCLGKVSGKGNVLEVFKNYSMQHADENVIVYYDLQWCGGAYNGRDTIKELFDRVDDCAKVVLFTTDVEQSYYKDMKVDTVIMIQNYFKKGLYKKQMKQLAKMSVEMGGRKMAFWEFSPAMMQVWRNGEYITGFSSLYEESVKAPYYCE